MRTVMHPLPSGTPGTARQLRSLHFGETATGEASSQPGLKAYIQASLHADEIPPMLVAQSLIRRLQLLEDAGDLLGQVVLVPMANPIGLAQECLGQALGRFDLATGINFNRHHGLHSHTIWGRVGLQLGSDSVQNKELVRRALREILEEAPAETETQALKQRLALLAADADVVLDLHCDNQAVMHLYAPASQREAFGPLSALLGAQAFLCSDEAGDQPFDESLARIWWEVAALAGPLKPVDPCGCIAATVELRGECDVSLELAEQDAQAIVAFLALRGFVRGRALDATPSSKVAQLPAPLCEATPLEGVEPLVATQAGVLVFLKTPGDWVNAGEAVAQVIDPMTDERHTIRASQAGRCFARTARRFASRGMRIAKIAGVTAWRSGSLLSP